MQINALLVNLSRSLEYPLRNDGLESLLELNLHKRFQTRRHKFRTLNELRAWWRFSGLVETASRPAPQSAGVRAFLRVDATLLISIGCINVESVMALALTCQLVYDHVRRHLEQMIDKMGSWNGDRLVILNNAAQFHDLPPSAYDFFSREGPIYLPSRELVEQGTGFVPSYVIDDANDPGRVVIMPRFTHISGLKTFIPHSDLRFTGFAAEELLDKWIDEAIARRKLRRPERLYKSDWLPHNILKYLTYFEQPWMHWLEALQWQATFTTVEPLETADDTLLARNLCEQLFVSGSSFVRRIPASVGTRLGDILPYIIMVPTPYNDGRDLSSWAGHRLEICRKTGASLEDWDDISDLVLDYAVGSRENYARLADAAWASDYRDIEGEESESDRTTLVDESEAADSHKLPVNNATSGIIGSFTEAVRSQSDTRLGNASAVANLDDAIVLCQDVDPQLGPALFNRVRRKTIHYSV